jgi:hypothetical protein
MRWILIQVCIYLWTDLLGNRFTDLRSNLDEGKSNLLFKSKAYKTIQSIYSLLMTSSKKATISQSGMFGISTSLKVKVKENIDHEMEIPDVLPFEYAEFIDEINKYVLSPKKKKRMIIFTDNLNHLDLNFQEDILERYLDLFKTKQGQFFFIVGFSNWNKQPLYPTCFETIMELKGFSSPRFVQQLIYRRAKDIRIEKTIPTYLFSEIGGSPRDILEICYKSYDYVLNTNLPSMTLEIVKNSCKEREVYLQKQEIRRQQEIKLQGPDIFN